ncbi:hypothetical protein GQ55_3G051300 [Panicum hallii var. hallii]|uniref:PsbP C-terminal domain-containing protein n=3 Tax=Panicum hallii TaxID=206008 RepID=A0A2T7E5W6_9POAL|nr:hypothetical protein PAHAL_3G053400 [Panicum hallii]PUZ63225.1 hypothetical protein GQ55_3G051300 [Panicum hallii var. hallii]
MRRRARGRGQQWWGGGVHWLLLLLSVELQCLGLQAMAWRPRRGCWQGGSPACQNLMNMTGWRTYRRPDDKSGGHGVGWSPIIPYSFKVPDGWDEVPVSIADLGGTEIDLRFANPKEGRLFVIVAPVRRFADDLDDATIEKIGSPEKVIGAFGPEVIGENVEGKVLSSATEEHSGRTYYQFELEPPHVFITATAAGNRLYLFSVTANGLQWKRHYKDLKQIAESFRVV